MAKICFARIRARTHLDVFVIIYLRSRHVEVEFPVVGVFVSKSFWSLFFKYYLIVHFIVGSWILLNSMAIHLKIVYPPLIIPCTLLQEDYRNNLPQPQLQQQKLRVCEVCAAYLCLYDNDRRLVDMLPCDSGAPELPHDTVRCVDNAHLPPTWPSREYVLGLCWLQLRFTSSFVSLYVCNMSCWSDQYAAIIPAFDRLHSVLAFEY